MRLRSSIFGKSFREGHLTSQTLDIRMFGAPDIRHYQNSTQTQEKHWAFEKIASDNVQKCLFVTKNITRTFKQLEHGY